MLLSGLRLPVPRRRRLALLVRSRPVSPASPEPPMLLPHRYRPLASNPTHGSRATRAFSAPRWEVEGTSSSSRCCCGSEGSIGDGGNVQGVPGGVGDVLETHAVCCTTHPPNHRRNSAIGAPVQPYVTASRWWVHLHAAAWPRCTCRGRLPLLLLGRSAAPLPAVRCWPGSSRLLAGPL